LSGCQTSSSAHSTSSHPRTRIVFCRAGPLKPRAPIRLPACTCFSFTMATLSGPRSSRVVRSRPRGMRP
jgi:hypothetical protein